MDKECGGVLITCDDEESKIIKAYILKALKNARLDYIKKQKYIYEKELLLGDPFFEEYSETEASKESMESISATLDFNFSFENVNLLKKYAQLSQKQKSIITYKILGYSNKEISGLLDISDRAVRKHLQLLKSIFSEYENLY